MKEFFDQILQRCEHAENTSRNSISIWQLFLIGFHVYILCIGEVGIGAAFYCFLTLFICASQLLLRNLKPVAREQSTKSVFIRAQTVFCLLNFINSIMQIFVATKQPHFEFTSEFATIFARLFCIQNAAYYTIVFVFILITFYKYKRRSKTGITEAVLIEYQTARVDKWLKTHYPQISIDASKLDLSDSDISTSSNEDENSDCSICLDTFKTEELVCRLKCRHYYHIDCIFEWIKHRNSRGTCPLCKQVNHLEQVV